MLVIGSWRLALSLIASKKQSAALCVTDIASAARSLKGFLARQNSHLHLPNILDQRPFTHISAFTIKINYYKKKVASHTRLKNPAFQAAILVPTMNEKNSVETPLLNYFLQLLAIAVGVLFWCLCYPWVFCRGECSPAGSHCKSIIVDDTVHFQCKPPMSLR